MQINSIFLCGFFSLQFLVICSESSSVPAIKGGSLRLRGGASYDDYDIDPQLRAEVLEDAYRMQEGKLPRFLETIGDYDDEYGQYRCFQDTKFDSMM